MLQFNIFNIVLLTGFIYLFYIVQNLKKENFAATGNLQDLDVAAIKSLSDIAQKLTQGGLTIPGNVIIDGKLTVKNGSDFSGGRHYFQDSEKAGRLRVGAAWAKPGIYAEDGKEIIMGSATNKVNLIGKTIAHTLDVTSKVTSANLLVTSRSDLNKYVHMDRLDIKNQNGQYTHFNYGNQNKNFIRNGVQLDGKVNFGTPFYIETTGGNLLSNALERSKDYATKNWGHVNKFKTFFYHP
jgi:hypothetical protein